MKRRKIVAVIGSSTAGKEERELAYEAGRLIAKMGFVLVNGGMGGVMEAASKGASEEGGLVVGILPTATAEGGNEYLSVPVVTNMGHARNAIIAHTADAILAIGGEEGTLSEIAIGRKLGKPVAGIKTWNVAGVKIFDLVAEAMEWIKKEI